MFTRISHKWLSRFVLLTLVSLAFLVLSACSTSSSAAASQATSSGSTPESTSGPVVVQVTEKDYSIVLSKGTIRPGQVEFDLSNQGPSEHEFVIFKTDLAQDQLPTKNALVDETASSLTKVYEQNQYPADTSKTATVNLDAGNYVIICNLPGHYQQGMHAALTVTSDASSSQTTSSSTSAPEATATPTAAAQDTSAQSSSGSENQGVTVGVIEKNYDIFVDRDSVPAGMVTFNLSNEGVSTHEFVIFKTDLSADNLPVKDAQVQEDSPKLEKIAEEPEFPPSETRQFSLRLDPGHYLLLCNLPDHYQQGMSIDFTVTGTASASSGSTTTSESSSSTSTQAATQVSVIEQNYGIYLNQVMIPAGQVEFDLSNLGPDQHEFVVFKTDLAPDQLPVQNGQVNESASSLQKIDEQQEYPSGDTRTLTVSLDPGNYVLICNIVGHYEQGMHIGFTVTDSSAQGSDIQPVAESTGTVSVIEKNYGIYLNTSAVPAGQVQFDLSNLGPDQHEFVVFKTDLAADQLPVENGLVNENAASLQKQDEQQEYPSGETRTLTLTLDPGHYVLICNLPGHYEQGMHVDFNVTEAASSSSSSTATNGQSSSTTQTASSSSSGTAASGQSSSTSIQQAQALVEAPASGKVSVVEGNFQIFLNRSTIPAGQVKFGLTNIGPDEHEFVVFKTDLSPDQLPVENGQVIEDDPALQKIGEQEKFPAGETRTLSLDLQPGAYVVICNLPGHYEQGMRFGLTVTPAHQQVNVIEKSYSILLNRSSVLAGLVDFDLTNLGPDPHEFVVFKTNLSPDQLPVENDQVVEDAASLVKIGEQEQYPANENRTLTLELDPGHYVLICNLPDHYQQGMYFSLTVLPS